MISLITSSTTDPSSLHLIDLAEWLDFFCEFLFPSYNTNSSIVHASSLIFHGNLIWGGGWESPGNDKK
jgi:hypothetical protein